MYNVQYLINTRLLTLEEIYKSTNISLNLHSQIKITTMNDEKATQSVCQLFLQTVTMRRVSPRPPYTLRSVRVLEAEFSSLQEHNLGSPT
jgi:hypothetical protein